MSGSAGVRTRCPVPSARAMSRCSDPAGVRLLQTMIPLVDGWPPPVDAEALAPAVHVTANPRIAAAVVIRPTCMVPPAGGMCDAS